MAIQKFAIDVAHRLSSLRTFLDAFDDLARYSERLRDVDVQRHARKLLAIVEVARTTLDRAGVKLHLFTSCSARLQPFKSAYFKMLVLVVRQNQDQFPQELRGRVDRLLLPLSTQLVIWRNHDPYAQLGIADLMKNIDSRSRPQGTPPPPSSAPLPPRLPPWPLHNIAASMPPPDAFPPRPSAPRKSLRARPVHKQHPPRPEFEPVPPSADDEPARPLSRARRHFGIFCTGNKRR